MPSVFISYSHDSDPHRDFVRGIADRLRQDGVDCLIDQYINGFPEQGWQRWMEDQIETADFVLLVCTESYLLRFRGHETQGGKGVNFEGVVISQALYDSYYKNTKFIPTIPNTGSLDHVPVPLRPYSTYRLDSQYDDVYRIITGQAKYQQPDLGAIRQLPPAHTESFRRIYSDDLPTVEGELFGRKEELALLDHAFSGTDTNIVQFVASGGTGKTKLIRTWLDDNTNKIDGLIAWSFYSQGSSEDKQISATPFFMQALKSLRSDKDISDFNTEEEKGEHIADLLRERRCLLVLDGLEPLQQVGRGMRGELKDRAIRKLLRCLVGSHSSLCIITTRLPVHELKDRRRVVQHDLRNLAPEDGVALLRSFGVSGRDADMLAAVEEYGRHALALHLLGNALATYLDGDVRKRDTLGELIGDYDEMERHAFKVMQAYERWLEGTVELKLLYLLGLFDHPVEQEVLEVLWEAEISGLTAPEPLKFLQRIINSKKLQHGHSKKDWKVAQRNLIFKYRMLSAYDGKDDLFDCHPLIKEYFGKQLKANRAAIWKQVHIRLYEYYEKLPVKLSGNYLPKTLAEMQPLFFAVSHGCAAGFFQKVIDEIYWERIKRKELHFITYKLGGYNDELSVLANFFCSPWDKISPSLEYISRTAVLSWAGYNLHTTGRIREALPVYQSALELLIEDENWNNANSQLINLIELYLSLGKIQDAKIKISEGFNFPLSSEPGEKTKNNIIILAYINYLEGKKTSLDVLISATGSIKSRNINHTGMSALSFFYISNIYVFHKKKKELAKLYQYIKSKLSLNRKSNLEKAMIFLSCWIIENKIKKTSNEKYLNKAIKKLREISAYNFLVYGLILQAINYRRLSKSSLAIQSLQELYEVAEPSGMRLHLTDYHLEMARLILAVEADPTQYPEATPDREQRTLPFADQEEPGILTLEGHIAEADRLIQETGYHRRDAELAELKQQAGMPC